MAIEKNVLGLNLSISYDAGVVDWKQRTMRRSFSNINKLASDEQIYLTGDTIAELCERDLISLELRTVESLREY